MKENKSDKGNLFDRIFKENAKSIFMPLIEMELGFKFKSYNILQEKITKTLEREVDFLCEIITEEEEKELLHIEFQSKDNNEMIYRMQEYHALINRKYKLPVRHIVIYLGERESKMKTQLSDNEVFKGFYLISINEMDAAKLLSTQVPEIVILAMLGKYKKKQIENILRMVLKNLKEVSESIDETKRYVNQLLLLSRLRKLEEKIIKILEDMPLEIDLNTDVLYNKGLEQGLEEGLERGLEKSIIGFYKEGVSIPKIAKALSISEEKVIQVIEAWKKKS